MPGTGGCGKSTNPYYTYACAITLDAPYYLATMTDPGGTLPIHKTGFLCQVRGSKYSVAKRVDHWWARLWVSFHDIAVWVPLVYLKGAPSGDKPVPGLPLCDGAIEPTR